MLGRIATGCGLGLLAIFVCSGMARPFGNGDEVIYAEHVRRMLESGDLLTLRWYDVEVLQRPSLPFALASLGARLVPGEPGLRLTSTLAALLMLAVLYLYLMARFGRRDVALLAITACAGAPTFHAYGALLLSDPPFVLGTTVAVISALRALEEPRYLLGVGAGLGWALACKSLAVAVVAVALAPVLLFVLLRPTRALRPSAGQILGACAMLLALGLPFYVTGFAVHGRRFLDEHFAYSLLRRASGELGSASMGGPLTYLEWLWTADGPLCCAWMLGAVAVAGVLGARRRAPELLALALLPVALLALYSAVGSRLPHYLLPMYPGAALTLAHGYAELTGGRRTLPGLRGGYAVLAAMGVLLIGQWGDAAERHLKYDAAAVVLGKRAGPLAAPGETIYAHEWYAPAFGYYAERPFRLTTNIKRRWAALDSVDFLRAAGVPAAVPPAPVRAGSSMLVAGPAAALEKADWMATEEVIASSEGIFLVRARAIDPRTRSRAAAAPP